MDLGLDRRVEPRHFECQRPPELGWGVFSLSEEKETRTSLLPF
jgi:hypothetical protein